MKRGDRKRLADTLEALGGTVRQTRSGFIAMHPVTRRSVTWHASPSSDSRRADKNLLADIRRAGFELAN